MLIAKLAAENHAQKYFPSTVILDYEERWPGSGILEFVARHVKETFQLHTAMVLAKIHPRCSHRLAHDRYSPIATCVGQSRYYDMPNRCLLPDELARLVAEYADAPDGAVALWDYHEVHR